MAQKFTNFEPQYLPKFFRSFVPISKPSRKTLLKWITINKIIRESIDKHVAAVFWTLSFFSLEPQFSPKMKIFWSHGLCTTSLHSPVNFCWKVLILWRVIQINVFYHDFQNLTQFMTSILSNPYFFKFAMLWKLSKAPLLSSD